VGVVVVGVVVGVVVVGVGVVVVVVGVGVGVVGVVVVGVGVVVVGVVEGVPCRMKYEYDHEYEYESLHLVRFFLSLVQYWCRTITVHIVKLTAVLDTVQYR
jgi:hypothetical protein